MSMPASFEMTEPLQFEAPPARHYCMCGLVFEAETEEQAVRLHREHSDEMRDPAAHSGSAF